MATTEPSADPQGIPAPPGLFTRQATGLVRGISARGGLAINLGFLGPPLVVLAATTVPQVWIGASSTWSAVLGTIVSIFPILSYALFTVAMPRSGGDYIFVGRTIHPWLGFIANFNMAIFGFTLGLAADMYMLVTFGLSTTFSTIGEATRSSTLLQWAHSVTTSGWAFGIGAACLFVIALMLCLRLKWLLRTLQIMIVFMIVGLLVTLGIMLASTRSDFVHAVTSYGGNYQGIIQSGVKAGFAATNHISLTATLLAVPFTIGLYIWCTGTSYVGGELRNPRRSALQSGLVSLALVGVMSVVLFALAEHVFGNAFLGSATTLSASGSKAYPFATGSFFFFFVTMLSHSTFLAVVMGIGFMASYFALCATLMLGAVRSMFAWSFDRILPMRLSYVNDQGAPVVAAVTALVLSVAYLAFMCFISTATGVKIFFTVVVGQLLTFLLVGVAAAVFPFVRRDMYEQSFARWAIGKVPVMSIFGVLAAATIAYGMEGFLSNDSLGANNTPGLITWAVVLVLGTVIWPISYYYNKQRGVDLLISGRELPPE